MKFQPLHSWFAITLLLFGCNPEPEPYNLNITNDLFEKSDSYQIIVIPEESTGSLNAEDIFSEIKHIDLKELVGNVFGIEIIDSTILINTHRSILYYNFDGNQINKLERLGRGPGEYLTIFGWSIAPSEEIMAISDRTAVYLYSISGDFIRQIELPTLPFYSTSSLQFISDDILILENDRTQSDYEDGFSPLWAINIKDNSQYPIFENYPASVNKFYKKYAFYGHMQYLDHSMNYMAWADSYNIYTITPSNNPKIHFTLDFGERSLPPGILYDAENYHEYASKYAIPHPVYTTEKYVFIRYNLNDINQVAVFDRSENQVIFHQDDSRGIAYNEVKSDLLYWPALVLDGNTIVATHEPVTPSDNYSISIIKLK